MISITEKGSYRVASAPVLALLITPWATGVQADEYSLEYSVKTRTQYNDNINLQPNSPIDVTGVKMSLPATLTIRNEQLQGSVTGEVSSSKYDESGYNSDNQKLVADGSYRTERGAVNGSAGFIRSSTKNTEFLDTGVVGLEASRVETGTIGAGIQRYLSERNSLIANANYRQTDYDSPRFRDNEMLSAYAGLEHKWTENTTLRLQPYWSRFENEANLKIVSDSLGLQTGFDSNVSENLNVSALAGWVTVDSDYSSNTAANTPDDDSSSGWVIDSSVNYKQERSTLAAKFVRRSTGSGNGYLQVSSVLTLSYSYELSPRSNFGLELLAGTSGALDDRIENDRDYAKAHFKLRYRITESWSVAGAYSYSYQDREQQSGDADSNAVYASLIFSPTKKIWSR